MGQFCLAEVADNSDLGSAFRPLMAALVTYQIAMRDAERYKQLYEAELARSAGVEASCDEVIPRYLWIERSGEEFDGWMLSCRQSRNIR